jgi:Fe-Mn family superoxide dismutase
MPTRREVLEGAAIVAGALVAPRWAGAAKEDAPAPATFSLPPLPYAADALEPYLDGETMRLHHGKHHATYVSKLNEAVAATPAIAGWSLERLLGDLAAVPESARTAIRNHGGGHANHTLFWTSLAPARGNAPRALPPGGFASAVAAEFGSLARLEEVLTGSALGLFGSGWAWLSRGADGKLAVETTPNQDSPLTAGRRPLLGIDVWEHAYYLKYQNRRGDYLGALLQVIDWTAVAGRFEPRPG